MIPIYISEDNLQMLEYQKKCIEDYCMIQNYSFEICIASTDPYEVLETVKKNKRRGIYFLDVDLKQEMNGFDLGVEIRKIDTRGFLTYITTHDEMLIETFKYRLEVMDYIVKDDIEEMRNRIHETLDQIYEYISKSDDNEKEYFKVKSFGSIRQIPVEDILFFETSSRKHVVVLHLMNELVEFHGSLQEVIEQVPESFVRVHRSYIININKVSSLDVKELVVRFENGEGANVARNMRRQLKELL